MKRFVFLVFSVLIFSGVVAQNDAYHSDVLWVTTPNQADWLYRLGENAEIKVSLYQYGILQKGREVTYSIGGDMMPEEWSGSAILEDGEAIVSIGTIEQPGFLDCRLSVELDGQVYKHHIKVGFEPDKLLPYTTLPDDFMSFWTGAKIKAAECPMVFTKTFVPEYSSDKIDCYLVKLQTYRKGDYVYGYLTIPKGDGPFPVVFSPPGAGIKPMNPMKDLFYAESGFIRFDMEIHGIRPNLDAETYKSISQAFGSDNNSYLVNGLDDRDSYYMKKVYLSCVRAIDFLTSLPGWDGKNVIVQGGSQGGALALVTAGLDDRVTACAANHPALSDMAGYKAGRAGGYPHLFTRFSGMDTPQKMKTLQYYDVVNFARQIKVPVFMTWGYNDNVCPPTTSYIIYNILSCEKEALITPENEHWISLTTRHRILDWIRGQLQ